jgi:Protein of unknown function (DUF3575)
LRFASALSLLAATSLLAGAASAQAVTAPKTAVISIQPLSAVFGVYSAEFEKALAPTVTLGVGGSYWSHDDDVSTTKYTSGDIKLRYYPEAHPFRGFSFGGQAGYTSLSDETTFAGSGSDKTKASGPTLGVALDYSWLLGESKSFYVGLGLGAKKIFASAKDIGDATLAYPTAHVSIGYAF